MENLSVIKNQTYGVEVEFTGITRQQAANIIGQYFGNGTIGTNARDNSGRSWKIVSDGSINSTLRNGSAASRDYSCELVTPILNYEDIETLQEIIRLLRKGGAVVNNSCGIHIHIGKDHHNAKTLRNLINLVYSKEDLMFEAFGVNPSRKERYCKPVENSLVSGVNQTKPKNLDSLGRLWYGGMSSGSGHYDSSRYHGLNLHNVWYASTVEFRYFNSTLHAGKIKSYIQFCLAVSAQAICQKSSKASKSQTENAKYSFRCWLLRLGMIGEEFATARLHLMKNLEGDSSFRNGRRPA